MTAISSSSKDNSNEETFNPVWALMIAISAATLAAPFIKLTQEAGLPSPLVAAGRLLLAFFALTPLVLTRYRAELARLSRRDISLSLFAGFWIGLHFLLMIYALEYTSIIITQVIVNTGPIWVALLETRILKARLSQRTWMGLAVAMIGGAFIALTAGAPTESASNPLLGTGLAIAGAIAGASYITTGRSVRAKVSMVPYVWMLFGTGGAFALSVALVQGHSITGHPTAAYGWLLALTLIPQLVGHSGFNYALGYMKATTISLTSQVVSVTAPIAAFFIFSEVPTIANLIGGAIVICGVVLAITGRQAKPKPDGSTT